MSDYNSIIVLGPTASGKTKLASQIAYELNGEIISADSRQVYSGLDIGTGKDLFEYTVNNKKIPFHLINICSPEKQFFLHEFILQSKIAFEEIQKRGHLPVICGGSGLYLDSFRKDFSLTQIGEDHELRAKLELLSKEELQNLLKDEKSLNHVDLNSKKRMIRALEILQYFQKNGTPTKQNLPYKPFYIGIEVSQDERKLRIRKRLVSRLEDGLIEEVEGLLVSGIDHSRLQFLGLEYKFLSFYLQHKLSKEEMIEQLFTAIVQFSKRQMTWFRKMEKEGVNIHWTKLDSMEGMLEKLKTVFKE